MNDVDYPFHFGFEKTLQAAGLLLSLEGGKSNYMRLIKLLYIADRESIKEANDPITGDTPFAMERGPVLPHVLDFIKGKRTQAPHWQKHIQTQGYDAQLVSDPGRGALSRYEIDKLTEISRRYKDNDEWEMVNVCHELEEWKRNDPGKSAKAIPFRDILAALGRSGDADAIYEEAAARRKFERNLAQALA